MRNNEYKFVETDPDILTAELIASYEEITGHTVKPADPERLFIAWLANILVQERVYQNYTANQNIPSRADGANLDALGEWIYSMKRKTAQAAKCIVRFNISAEQKEAIPIPAGTRITDRQHTLYWQTTIDTIIPAGSTYADVMAQCETEGTAGNGYTIGQINTLVDASNIMYFSSCANTTESDGGSDTENDDEYFEMMKKKLSSFSTAGAEASYVYWAKSVSDDIADVKAIRPVKTVTEKLNVFEDGEGNHCIFIGGDFIESDALNVSAAGGQTLIKDTDYTVEYEDGLMKITLLPDGQAASAGSVSVTYRKCQATHVNIYALMNDGTVAGSTIKTLIKEACSAEDVRPLTDYVSVEEPAKVEYDIDLTYYINNDAQESLAAIQNAVNKTIEEYTSWQSANLGRDINPSKLHSMLMDTGIKRLEIRSPVFQRLGDGTDGIAPQIAVLNKCTVTNGGYEDE